MKYKKYLILAHDVLSLILKKRLVVQKELAEENARKLRIALIITCILLLISVVINIILVIG